MTNDFQQVLKQRLAVSILFLAGLIYAALSLVNHYLFRTYALDLGIYNNALYDYAHFRFNDYPLVRQLFPNALADHFSLMPMLASPLLWLFGTYALLIVQIAAILFGGWGIYRFFADKYPNTYLPHLALIHFLSLWGIFSALSFDYHDNVIGAMLVPWFLYYFDKNEKRKYMLFFVLLLITKENMALWAVFISLGLAIQHRRDRQRMLQALFLTVCSALYFFIIVNVVMKSMGYPDRAYFHFKYAALGASPMEAIQNVFLHPVDVFRLFFVNHSKEPFFDGIKTELYTLVIFSGGFALIYYPHLLLMLLPIVAQKVLSDDVCKWGINYQYSIEFAPVLTIAAFSLLLNFKSTKLRYFLALLTVIIAFYIHLHAYKERKSVWFKPADYVLWSPLHWHTPYDISSINKALESIPAEAAVSASSPLVPHLAFRQRIYQFPDTADATYILLLEQPEPYPLKLEELQQQVMALRAASDWELIYDKKLLKIFKKRY